MRNCALRSRLKSRIAPKTIAATEEIRRLDLFILRRQTDHEQQQEGLPT